MLHGIRIIDFTSHLAGPYCTWLLACLGAEVIKIERPGGDPARAVGPHVGGESLYFSSVNRNKQSIVLDLTSAIDAKILQRLIGRSDVLVENLKPGALARLGFTDRLIADLNPKIIHASISGFGQDGPMRERPAFDIIVQAMSGMMSITGPEGGPPVRAGVSLGDLSAGLFAAIDILASLLARERGGKRRRLDVSMLDCQLALLENAAARHLNAGVVPVPLGSRHPSIAPFQTFDTQDGQIAVAADGEEAWMRFCSALELPRLALDPLFSSNAARVHNHKELECVLSERFASHSTHEWLDRLVAAQIPAAPVNDIPTALTNPQFAARRMVSTIKTPGGTELRFVACPIGERNIDRPAPRLNEQADTVTSMRSEIAGGYTPTSP